jgi:cephalosporin hydroxylase
MSLWSEFLTNGGRPIHKWTHYFPIYERHFGSFVNRATTFIEIGVSKGGSLQLWKRYLSPFAQIVGIDIDPTCKAVEEDQIAIRIGNQGDPAFLQQIIDEFGPPDIVLDDGSHMMSHITASFKFLYPQMSKNGVYIVEDLHTAYWNEYEGGLHRAGSFIEQSKAFIDELNADHSRDAVPISEFSKTTVSMHFYDSVIVFERGRHLKKHAPIIGLTPYEPSPRTSPLK